MLIHTKVEIDGRCIDLLMTEEEVIACFKRALLNENFKYINLENSCNSWPVQKPKTCIFWKKLLGICDCDD